MRTLISDILTQEANQFGISLSNQELDSFEIYARELKKWNGKVNLTSITKDIEIVIKHFIDSLRIAPYISKNDRLLDIGSGAGLPVIPLKIIMSDISMVSVDAVAKKIHFQRHVMRLLNLSNIEAIHTRIETLPKTQNKSFSIITSRAFTRLDRFVALAAPLLTEDGTLLAMKGSEVENEMVASDGAVNAAGFIVTSVHSYTLPHNMGNRAITVLKRAKGA